MESDQFEPEFILVLPRIKGITQLKNNSGNKGFFEGKLEMKHCGLECFGTQAVLIWVLILIQDTQQF